MNTAVVVTKQYIEKREDCYRIVGKRVSLDSIIAEFAATQTSSGVIIVLQSLPISEAINNLIEIWQKAEAEAWINRIAYLPL